MKIPKPIQERRRAIRVEESLPFRIGHDSYQVELRTINISKSGVLCLSDRSIPVMTKVKVALSIPAGALANGRLHVLRTAGVVVRNERDPDSGKFYVAVFFSEIKESEHRLLEEFIQRRLNS